jgi:CheY-like chemotaxis protein
VDVKSAGPGLGAVFSVAIPVGSTPDTRAAGAQVDAFRRLPSGSRRASDLPRLDGASIIFVDDRPEARDIVEELLGRFGAKVTCTETAEQALEAIARSIPDVLISDIGLPDQDGYALMRRVRALEGAAAHVPAIALTAYARPEDAHRAKDAGFNVYLSKPIEPDELVWLVSSLLADRGERSGCTLSQEEATSRGSVDLSIDDASSHGGAHAASFS